MRKRFGGKLKKEKEEFEVDITSLLDILVILLVFLLKSYNASDLKLEVAKKISLPPSKSQQLGHMAVIVQVSAERDLWINNKNVGKLGAGEKIDLLYDELARIKSEQDRIIVEMEARTPAGADINNEALASRKANQKRVNIVLDQSLPYSVLRRVMHTSALAGFPEFKFIVQGNF